jgi:dihydroxyacetone kinase
LLFIYDYYWNQSGEEVALVVNSLGCLPPLELNVVSHAALAWLKDEGLLVRRVYVGAFMTSLDMNGFSLTLMRVDQHTMQRFVRKNKLINT